MRRCQTPVAVLLSMSLLLGAAFQPAQAAGLIGTERVVQPAPVAAAALTVPAFDPNAPPRAVLLQAMLQAGVEPAQAQARVAALTDAEVAALSTHFDQAPAGGLWFAPFLVVAIVIGALIGVRSQGADASATDFFGRPRKVAATP